MNHALRFAPGFVAIIFMALLAAPALAQGMMGGMIDPLARGCDMSKGYRWGSCHAYSQAKGDDNCDQVCKPQRACPAGSDPMEQYMRDTCEPLTSKKAADWKVRGTRCPDGKATCTFNENVND
jgi:hypothetical protein